MTTKIKSGVIGDNVVGITQLNVSDGTNGQYLQTDGAGTLSFSTISGYTDSDVETYLDGGTSTPTFSTITSEGTVTINPSSGDGVLNIQNGADTQTLRIDQNSIRTTTNSDINLFTNGNSNQLFLKQSTGNVGIGTDSPSGELHILSTTADTDLWVETTSAGGDARLNLYANSTGDSQIRFGDGDDANVGALTYDHSTNAMVFRGNDAEKLRILSTGGITFNGDTATANALDDYEEGTFTVTATPSVSGTVTLSSLNVGYYTKIGNRVFFSYRVDVASVSSPSGRLNMNLPFTVANISPASSSRSTATTFVYNSVSTNIGDFVSFIPTGTSFVSIYVGSTATGSNTSANQMQSGTEIHLAGHYITN